jgi:hypothetical protein
MTAMRLKRYPSPSGGFALGKMGVGATLLKQGKTAKDYVQDGLQCLMDCKEGGFFDLKGNVTRTDTGVVEVSSNGAVYNNGVSSALSGLTTSADCSWEFVFTSPESTSGSFAAFIGRATIDGATTGIELTFSHLSGTGLRYRIWAATWASGLYTFTPNTPQAFGFVRGSGIRQSYIRGGTYVQSRSQNDFMPNPNGTAEIRGPVRFYNIRVYNRMLTADEIAANYDIDQERFNLP